MDRRPLVTIIVVALMMGFAFEWMKSARQRARLAKAGITQAELADMDLSPYTRQDIDRDRISDPSKSGRMMRLAGVPSESHTFTNPQPPKGTGKDQEEKKKKKKKKEKKKKTDDLEQQQEDDDAEEIADDDSSRPSLPQSGSGTLPGGAGGGPNTVPTRYDEWARLLLLDPDFSATSRFINYYQLGMVDDATFYRLITEMLQDPRPRMQELGVMALNATPSFKSFMTLANFQESLASNQPLRAKIQGDLKNTYSQMRYLNVLTMVLTQSESSYPIILATQVVLDAARLHLGSQNSTSNNQGSANTPPTNEPTSAQNRAENALEARKRAFAGIVRALRRLVQSGGDASVTQSATQTLAQIEPLVGSDTVAQDDEANENPPSVAGINR